MVAPGEVARYYALGDIFISSSQSETQGLTYIEAMAAGRRYYAARIHVYPASLKMAAMD